ncbi:MAG TPA: hypothetical protein VFI14_08350, partial [Chryseosolibacter sp.]|nr:hypothetical protein [Chryseosolibacter sp.]
MLSLNFFLKKSGHLCVAMMVISLSLSSCSSNDQTSFYVDPAKGSDSNSGTVERPFASFDK